jgi:hypothetical protein
MDFINHLLDAPLSNIMIVAGLLFLAVAAVGKVVGKIEPDKTGRIISGLLGTVLFLAGVATHIFGDAKKDHSKAEQSGPIQPIIHVFTVIPAHVTQGGKVKISWEVLNADNVVLEPFGQVTASGSATDQPQQTTIYRLTATNNSGGKQGTFQQIFVDAKPLTVSGPKRAVPPASPAPAIESSRPTPAVPVPPTIARVRAPSAVPNFAGSWKMTESIRNGRPMPIPPTMPPLTITQNGTTVRIPVQHGGTTDLPITDNGKVTQSFYSAEGYQDGRPRARQVETEREAALVQTDTWSLEGETLVEEITWNYKGPYFGHPFGTERGRVKYQRVSANPSGVTTR